MGDWGDWELQQIGNELGSVELSDEDEPMLSEHTPGPWVANRRFVTVVGSVDTWSGPVTGTIVEALETEQEDSEGRVWSCAGSAEANARLIAAAPDLLAVIKKLVAWRACDYAPQRSEVATLVMEALAAIAKTEGRKN